MSSDPRRPTPAQLSQDPELAVLAALDVLLELGTSALVAEHQGIGVDEEESRLTTLVLAIVSSSHNLRDLLRDYRAALAHSRRNIEF